MKERIFLSCPTLLTVSLFNLEGEGCILIHFFSAKKDCVNCPSTNYLRCIIIYSWKPVLQDNKLANVTLNGVHEHKRCPLHQHNEIPYLHATKCLPDPKFEHSCNQTEQNQVLSLKVTRICRAP